MYMDISMSAVKSVFFVYINLSKYFILFIIAVLNFFLFGLSLSSCIAPCFPNFLFLLLWCNVSLY